MRPSDPRLGRRISALAVLCLSQAIGAIGLAAGAVAGPLLAAQVLGAPGFGPLTLGLLVVGAALSGPAATTAMRRWGRARGLAGCHGTAAAGAGLVVASVPGGALPLLAGSVLLGAGTTGLMLGRYVAADLVPVTRRPQAMGLAVGAVTVGAVCGPVLLGPAGEVARWLGLPAPLGLYLLAVVVFPVAAVISLRIGEGAAIPAATGERIRAGPVRMKPLLVLGAANLTMVSVMGAAPNHLHHHGWGLTAIGVLIGVHIAAMYGPAPLTGALCRRFGARRIALAGTVVMVAAVLLGTRHGGPAWDITLLVLLGLAWNLGLVSGSAWLVEVTPAALRHRTEGLGELVMGTAAAAGALGAAGPLLAVGGLPVLCGVLAAGNVLAAIAIAWGRR